MREAEGGGEKGHPYPGLAMTGIVTPFKNLAKFGFKGARI